MQPTEEELRRNWGTKIAARRAELNWSQSRLAEAVGIQKETVSRIERGVYGGSDATRMAIAAALGVEVNDLYPYPSVAEQAS